MKKIAKTKSKSTSPSPSKMIDGRIKELADWRSQTLSQIREIVKDSDPEVIEEWKWRGVPVGTATE